MIQHNPKGPDGYGWKEYKVDDWMGKETVHDVSVGGFNVQLVISPSCRDWYLRVDVPEHFRHPNLRVCEHVGLYRASARDSD